MGANRVFFPQEALDAWMVEERVNIVGEEMTLNPGNRHFKLASALRFLGEVGGGGDANKLEGKVITKDRLNELGGEHYANSVLLGDDAYDVVEGFLCEPIEATASVATGNDVESATRAATGDMDPSEDVDPLAELFLKSN